MRYILVTKSFQKQLKKLRRYLREEDVVKDIKRFIQKGTGRQEAYLETLVVKPIKTQTVKLRLCVYQVNFRYLVLIIDDREYLPIIISLKKGQLGRNLSLKADKKTVKAIKAAAIAAVSDYLVHSEETPKLTPYVVED